MNRNDFYHLLLAILWVPANIITLLLLLNVTVPSESVSILLFIPQALVSFPVIIFGVILDAGGEAMKISRLIFSTIFFSLMHFSISSSRKPNFPSSRLFKVLLGWSGIGVLIILLLIFMLYVAVQNYSG